MTSTNIIERITSYNNLYWAWEKAKNTYQLGDIWFNEFEIANFEANLSSELQSIREEITKGMYNMTPIKPIGFPKKRDDNGPRTRQTFWISIRDQVSWLAVVNIIGQYLDAQMPFWSYGNRLYMSIFYEKSIDNKIQELKYGYYRNTTKFTYRKWTQSWPLYRRHINISARFLTSSDSNGPDFDLQEEEAIIQNKKLVKNHPLKVLYLDKTYWNKSNNEDLYWAGIDLEKFYPSLNVTVIHANIKKYGVKFYDDNLEKLLDSLLNFKVDIVGWDIEELTTIWTNKDELSKFNTGVISYHHLPTGLFVAGFLANVAMMQVDAEVSKKLNKNKEIAHFRFVDDHIILSKSFEELISWIENYKKIVSKNNIGSNVNEDKTEPRSITDYLKSDDSDSDRASKSEKARRESRLDPNFLSPLMTQTLAKVSSISKTEFQLLDPTEEKNLIADLEHLLITEFPDQELRRDTRISFAARMLSSLVPQLSFDDHIAYSLSKDIMLIEKDIKFQNVLLKIESNPIKKEKINKLIAGLKNDIKAAQQKLKVEKAILNEEEQRIVLRTMKLLLKSIRENHDKVRLWGRLFEFCFNSGKSDEMLILKELDSLLKNKETNELSLRFIRAIILQILSNLAWRSYKIINTGKYSHKRVSRARSHLIGLITNSGLISYFFSKINTQSKYYESVALQQFGITISILRHFFKFENFPVLPQNLKIINWDENIIENCRKLGVEFSTVAWWLSEKLSDIKNIETNNLWSNIIQQLDFTNARDVNVALLHFDLLPINVIHKIDKLENYDKVFKNEGIVFEIYERLRASDQNLDLRLFDKVKSKIYKYKEHITIYDWVLWMANQKREKIGSESQEIFFDPRHGEWMALAILKQIAEVINDDMEFSYITDLSKEKKDIVAIHPCNFKLPVKWINNVNELSWGDLKLLISGEKISLVAVKNRIYDERFSPETDKTDAGINQSILNGLGGLLLCLLSKSVALPKRWNPVGHQLAWLNLANQSLKDLSISSYTRDLIRACFSKRNIETQVLRQIFDAEFKYDLDTSYDPPKFLYIEDFIHYIELCQNKLELQQISITNNQPRQLTPVRLIKIKQEDYSKIIENGNS